MALYRCKFSIRDPLLIVLEAIDKTEGLTPLMAAQKIDLQGLATVGLEENETVIAINTVFLPVEYIFTDLIGLEVRKIQVSIQSSKLESAIELLVGNRKLIFFEQDLEKIRT